MDVYLCGYIISFSSLNRVCLLDSQECYKSEKKEQYLLQAISINAMIFRMYGLMRPYWKLKFIDNLKSLDGFFSNFEFNIITVDTPEEIQINKKGFAYRFIVENGKISNPNNQAFGFGILAKNIEEYSMLACLYIIFYLKMSNKTKGYHQNLNRMIRDIIVELEKHDDCSKAELDTSIFLAKKYFSQSK